MAKTPFPSESCERSEGGRRRLSSFLLSSRVSVFCLAAAISTRRKSNGMECAGGGGHKPTKEIFMDFRMAMAGECDLN